MSRLLDPALMMSLKNLQLAARTTIDGFMAGINKSKVKGPGLEFSQYRSYEPGDDLRWLDWKLYARSDRYYIRESEIETSIFVRILVDASASMLHKDGDFIKIEYARYLAASLAWLAHQQTDGIGLYVFQHNNLFTLPVKKDHQHLQRLCYQLENIQPGGSFTAPVHYKDLFSSGFRRELLIFITDFYQQDEEIFTLLETLSASRHEIIVFQVMGRNEIEMDYAGFNALEDLETGRVIRFDNNQDKTDYSKRLDDYFNAIRKRLAEKKYILSDDADGSAIKPGFKRFFKATESFKILTVVSTSSTGLDVGCCGNADSCIDPPLEYHDGQGIEGGNGGFSDGNY